MIRSGAGIYSNLGLSVSWVSSFVGVKGASPLHPLTREPTDKQQFEGSPNPLDKPPAILYNKGSKTAPYAGKEAL